MTYTRTVETEAQYRSRGDLLGQKFRAETMTGHLDPAKFATWLISKKQSLSASSWRVYRRSAMYTLAVSDHPNAGMAISMLEAALHAVPAERKTGPAKKKLTSATKVKTLPHVDYEKILAFLRFISRSKLSPTARAWIIAGMATGLRPAEWSDAMIIESDNQLIFRVLNAKATNERGNGKFRTMNISQFQPDTIKAIRHMSASGSQWQRDGRYPEMQAQVAQLIYKTCEQINLKDGNIYCLYSTRHQFTANMKSIKSRQEVSALLGHRVTRTAMESYGKKRSAWSPDHIVDVPVALDAEVETVTDNARLFSSSPIAARRLAA